MPPKFPTKIARGLDKRRTSEKEGASGGGNEPRPGFGFAPPVSPGDRSSFYFESGSADVVGSRGPVSRFVSVTGRAINAYEGPKTEAGRTRGRAPPETGRLRGGDKTPRRGRGVPNPGARRANAGCLQI